MTPKDIEKYHEYNRLRRSMARLTEVRDSKADNDFNGRAILAESIADIEARSDDIEIEFLNRFGATWAAQCEKMINQG